MNRTPIAAATLCAVLAACAAPPPAERGPVRVDSPKEPEGSQLDEAMRALGSPLDNPIAASGGTAILYGNLAPEGCVIKPPAAEPRLSRV